MAAPGQLLLRAAAALLLFCLPPRVRADEHVHTVRRARAEARPVRASEGRRYPGLAGGGGSWPAGRGRRAAPAAPLGLPSLLCGSGSSTGSRAVRVRAARSGRPGRAGTGASSAGLPGATGSVAAASAAALSRSRAHGRRAAVFAQRRAPPPSRAPSSASDGRPRRVCAGTAAKGFSKALQHPAESK